MVWTILKYGITILIHIVLALVLLIAFLKVLGIDKVLFTTFISVDSTQKSTQMKTINYVPTHVEPSKLDQVLAYCNNLSDEDKEKVCIIQDIAKIGRALGNPKMTTENFELLFEMPIVVLEHVQHAAQAELNTYEYKMRLSSLL